MSDAILSILFCIVLTFRQKLISIYLKINFKESKQKPKQIKYKPLTTITFI